MGFFNKKNPNEANYPGGEKHFVDVLKSDDMPQDALVWRFPAEDFNTGSTLIVPPGLEALFVKEGRVENVFREGKHRLTTANYPFLSRIRNAFSGGVSAYNAIVYFVRVTDSSEFRWGTQSPIQARDKVWGIRTELKARGAYRVRVVDSSRLLHVALGDRERFDRSQPDEYFRSQLQERIRTELSARVNRHDGELIGLDAQLAELSHDVKTGLKSVFGEHGLEIVAFAISALDVDTSKYDEIDASVVAQKREILEAQGKRTAMDVLGDGWQKLQSVEVMKEFAKNPNAGGLGATGGGIGAGLVVGTTVRDMAQTVFGSGQGGSGQDPVAALKSLKDALDAGLITQAEFDAKKSEILARI